jgi:MFS family permease
MNDVFERRVRAAAVAGWWTLLIAVGFLLIQWIGYLLVMSAHPAWMLSLWGPDITWSFVQNVWFWAIAILKVSVWPLALVALWLTLWAKQLRKRANG